MDKGIITISVDTTEEANKIREEFKNSEYYKDYKLNMLICGNEDMKKNLSNFLSARLKA